jgi:hypothetical protein
MMRNVADNVDESVRPYEEGDEGEMQWNGDSGYQSKSIAKRILQRV